MLEYKGIIEALHDGVFVLRTTDKDGKPIALSARIHASCQAPALQDGGYRPLENGPPSSAARKASPRSLCERSGSSRNDPKAVKGSV
jgi:hypothetical protein